MLFSNDKISNFINNNFEPSWESVRPVPTVTIDFGNDKKITRTLHGNIATYVCRSDKKILDVLPGVYDPDAYLKKLQELKLLAEFVVQRDAIGYDDDSRILQYHQVRAETIESGKEFKIAKMEVSRSTISGVEKSIKIVLNPARRLAARGAMGARERSQGLAGGESPRTSRLENETHVATRVAHTRGGNAETLDDRLRIDSAINEQTRRLQIHRYFLEKGLTTPSDMHKWLYREVLHADLDDPYMGLKKVLFENYPFTDEDAGRTELPTGPGTD